LVCVLLVLCTQHQTHDRCERKVPFVQCAFVQGFRCFHFLDREKDLF
jgi:hypothetical protein